MTYFFNMIQILLEDLFNQPASLEGESHAAAHGETSHANDEPGTANNVHMKGVHDVLQVVKEIQDTLKSELHDIRTKIDFLYAKFSELEKNRDEDLHNTNNPQKSKNHRPPHPTPNNPPPPISRPLLIPTLLKEILGCAKY